MGILCESLFLTTLEMVLIQNWLLTLIPTLTAVGANNAVHR